MSRQKHDSRGHLTALERWYILLIGLGVYDLYYFWTHQGVLSGQLIGATGIILLVTGMYGYASKRKFWHMPKLLLAGAVPAIVVATFGVLAQVMRVFGV